MLVNKRPWCLSNIAFINEETVSLFTDFCDFRRCDIDICFHQKIKAFYASFQEKDSRVAVFYSETETGNVFYYSF